MWLVILFLIATIGSTWSFKKALCDFEDGDAYFLAGFVLALIVLLISVCWPLVFFDCKNRIIAIEATRATIMRARDAGNALENAALIHKIVEMNQWLSSAKYFNETILDPFIPDEVESVEHLQ